MRARGVDPGRRALLVSDLKGSAQEDDLSEPVNCGGYGRIRHFSAAASPGWPANPLPAAPAAAALGLAPSSRISAQVFQNAICNWRCWYCFVPFTLLSGNPKRSAWFTAAELVDAYLALPGRPPVLDLSGGQRELVAAHPRYGRVCCFKGFDEESFAFNTRAAPELFARQFDLFARLLATGMDLYAYVTLTGPSLDRVAARFTERERCLPVTEVQLRQGSR